jgi:uncharacterized membrane protein
MLHPSPRFFCFSRFFTRLALKAVANCLLASLLVGAGITAPCWAQEASAPDAAAPKSPAKWVDFSKDIVPILREHCVKCHRGPQPKGGFDITDRAALLGYITPGSLEDSSLWSDYLTAKPIAEDPESLVMPPDGPLSKPKLALLKLWIEEGAAWPDGVAIDQDDAAVSTTVASNASMPRRIYLAIGYFHPAIVHFPVALLSLSGLCIMLSWVFGQGCVRFAYACLVLGALGALAAALMGWSFAETRGLMSWTEMIKSTADEQESNEFFHRWLGTLTAFASLAAAWMAYRAGKPDGTRPGWGWKTAALLLAALVGIVGHQGGEMVYGDIFAQALEQINRP